MKQYQLRIELTSDATFGRGDGVAGLIDAEVQYDSLGCPYLAGRTLKGLLAEEAANLLYALDQSGRSAPWVAVADDLFGAAGSTDATRSRLSVGDAVLPDELRAWVKQTGLSPSLVLESLTAIRRQSAMNPLTEAPLDDTLRSMRVVVRKTLFSAGITLADPYTTPAPASGPSETELAAFLAACVKALRRAGTGRNRGRGALTATLLDEQGGDVTGAAFALFAEEVQK